MTIGNLVQWLDPQVQSFGDFVFFDLILDYLTKEIREFGIEMMGRGMQWVGTMALVLMTCWIMFQGYRIVTGRSRESMMLLVTSSLRATLVLTIATSMAVFGADLHQLLGEGVKKEINWLVTGKHEDPEAAIDRNLAWMQVAMGSIDSIESAGDPSIEQAKTRAEWFTGIGTGGPALVGGTMLLLYEAAIALFLGLGPLFILSLLFDQTRGLFSRWLYYGIGTMFSMAVLSAMVSIALDMVSRVAAAFWGTALVGYLVGDDFSQGITSQAMQQGGLGIILTVLIVSTPPMAAMFFQGTLGYAATSSAFAGAGAAGGAHGPGAGGSYPGQRGYVPPPAATSAAADAGPPYTMLYHPSTPGLGAPLVAPGQRGLAPVTGRA